MAIHRQVIAGFFNNNYYNNFNMGIKTFKGLKLDRFQEEAINFADKGYSVIVSAPTGAGKTLIAEYIIEDCVKRGKGIIYTAPIKALSNQKFRDFSGKYPKSTGILTGDVGINQSCPILIMTTEIFRNNILSNPLKLKDRAWVIFDEIHYLDDIERGTVWEESIILLPKHMRMLALSATIPNISEFVKWLEFIHAFPLKTIIEKERPVPLHFHFQCNNKVFSNFQEFEESDYLKKNLKDKYLSKRLRSPFKPNKLATLAHHLKDKKALPCIYFTFSRRKCEDLASEVYDLNFLDRNEKEKIETIFLKLAQRFNIDRDPYVDYLFPLIKKGIAYHHAGLLPTLKEIIERLFTTGLIKLIFTTETFALGINMPAKTCVFDSLSKYYGRSRRYLKTRDFYQMAGRSGRRGIDREGYVYLKINPYHIDISALKEIIYGRYEPITSQFNNCYATILNLYKLMGEKIVDIYPYSFHFHQSDSFKKRQALDLLKRKLSLLKNANYILDNGTLSCKAELASKVYSFELQMGELFESGFMESLDESLLFVVISSLVYEPRKGEKRPRLSKKIKKARRDLEFLLQEIHKRERHFRIYPLSKKFYFHITEASRAWVEGTDFYKLNKFCDIDEGEIVRYFRMSIQVLREILSSEAVPLSLKLKINNCLKKVNREVVDAEKQLRQVI
ncbi:MAG: DEAD/DEAH box helicase [Candidatus Omnitrophica bacterium]|nr:DEAD/DEAH box helicase [Candidatus Omnitrophota bacterium]